MVASFDRVSALYDQTRSLPAQTMADAVEFLARKLGPAEPILDVGVGTGRFASPLQRLGLRVVGLDISRNMLEIARHKGADEIVRCEASQIPYKSSCFNTALMVHFLHLVPNWKEVLREVCRVTRNQLCALVITPRLPFSEEYNKALEKNGHERPPSGIREEQLARLVQPSEARMVAEYTMTVDIPERLKMIEARTFSEQWNVPEQLHKIAVEHLKSKFMLPTMEFPSRLTCLTWTIDSIREALATSDHLFKSLLHIPEQRHS